MSAIHPELDGQVIRMWTIIYDNNIDKIYYFFDWQKILQSLAGAIRTYLDDDAASQEIIDGLLEAMATDHGRPIIPLTMSRGKDKVLDITIYRWEFDRFTPLFSVLNKCYQLGDDALRLEIMGLLSNSQR